MNRNFLIGLIFSVNIVLDQWVKAVARTHLSGKYLSYWGDSIQLGLAENSGAFLSLGADMSETARFYVFTVGIGILMIAGLFLLIRKKNLDLATTISYALMLSGGVANLIDRGMKGTVTDYVSIGIGPVRTGVFNIADMAIMAALGILLVKNFQEGKQK